MWSGRRFASKSGGPLRGWRIWKRKFPNSADCSNNYPVNGGNPPGKSPPRRICSADSTKGDSPRRFAAASDRNYEAHMDARRKRRLVDMEVPNSVRCCPALKRKKGQRQPWTVSLQTASLWPGSSDFHWTELGGTEANFSSSAGQRATGIAGCIALRPASVRRGGRRNLIP